MNNDFYRNCTTPSFCAFAKDYYETVEGIRDDIHGAPSISSLLYRPWQTNHGRFLPPH